MSSDNCIAVLITTDKFQKIDEHTYKNMFDKPIETYRVAHIQAVDNFEWYEKNEIHNLGNWMADNFRNCEPIYDASDAQKYARDLQRKIGYTEYGIVPVDAFKYNFPGC